VPRTLRHPDYSDLTADSGSSCLTTFRVRQVDAAAEGAWGEEVKRRIGEIDSGKAKLIPADEVSVPNSRANRRAAYRVSALYA